MKPRTKEVWEFIKNYTEKESYPPTVREIRDAIGVKSPSVVIYHLKKLDAAGLIKRQGAGRRMVVCGAVTKINPIALTPDPSPTKRARGDKRASGGRKKARTPMPIPRVTGREYVGNGP